jgi:type I site-specific restriction-modification system R (restriction) subunit/very-short-patch-repair endonuclease
MTNNKLTESTIESFAIELLEVLGYHYIYAPDISHDSDSPERTSYEEVLLINRLREAVRRINPDTPSEVQEEAIKEIYRINSPELITNNEHFHRMLTEGIKVTYQRDNHPRGDLVWLIDFDNPENNDFVVANQFTVKYKSPLGDLGAKRPDLILFVNGIPLVVIELKNPTDENTTVRLAYRQLQTYKSTIPNLFTYNGFMIASDGLEAKAGSLSVGFTRFMAWKSADGKEEASNLVSQLEVLIKGMLNKETLLDLIRHFIVFEKSKKEDAKTGITTISTVKKLAAYHQYYAVNRAVESTLRATGFNSPPAEGWTGISRTGWSSPPAEGWTGISRTGWSSPPAEGWHSKNDGVVFPSTEGWHSKNDGVVFPSTEGWQRTLTGWYYSPPVEGWSLSENQTPYTKRSFSNFKNLPYNPALKERAKELRKAGNLPEVIFWKKVRNKSFKGLDFDRQKIIGNYIVDFYCSSHGVVIEIDGSSHDDDKYEYDRRRDEYLISLGLEVIHITAKDVFQNMRLVMEMLDSHPVFEETSQEDGREHPAFFEGTPPREGNTTPSVKYTDTPPREGNETQEGNWEESPESYGVVGVNQQAVGDRKGGVVWHTQGSGKSLSMVFYTGKIVLALNNPTILIITDRNDLDDQLFDTFASCTQLLRQVPKQADNRQELKDLLKVASGGVIFSTIQKFQPEEGNIYETLSERENIVVIADEAHRTQYGFKPKTIDDKDSAGNIIGKKIVYGFAKYMRDALPNATYLGFTGTPIESNDINTPAVFGNYIDVYDIAQAVEDGATVKIYYESRLAKIALTEEGRKLIDEVDEELADYSRSDQLKAKWTTLEALIGSENRIKKIAKDIISHFEQRQEVFSGKAMVVSMSRRIAAKLYDEIVALNPDWHSDALNKGAIKVVMTSASSDGPQIAKHHTTKQERKMLADRMRDPNDPLKMVIVRDMWLTGFDVPCLHTLYIDKPMKGHNLMQAIARVNRVYHDKPGGLIVDYLGIASDLKQALSFYSDAGGKGDPTILQEQAVRLMLEKLEVVSQMFHGFPYEDYFEADTSKKLTTILGAEEHILSIDDGKKRFINEVTALSKAFAIAVPHEQAMDVKEEVSFFQAVKARLVKFSSSSNGKSDEDIETTIRQVIDKALVTDQVIDVFDAAGIKKPNISILSEEFLQELKEMQHKNVAMEVLKKLLNDEIKARAKKNLVNSKSFMEMLENTIRKYQNKILTAAEVIDELINLSKEIVEADDQAKNMGLTEYEYAFYTAVANNKSAKELMLQDKLRELAVALTEKVRQNASIDWTIKESVRAKLKVIIKRTLRKYGYPPDMQKLATETVLKQAELIAAELVE